MENGITIDMTDEKQRKYFMICQIKSALKVEIAFPELRRRGQSAYAQAKQLFGLKGSKQKVWDQLEEMKKEMLK